ncbi:sigma-E factor regulatory protein RseB domain-containing protein [Actinokineospora cianjurensis]|uniref:Outer membrane lipoprotein-sorting protein n=1 Tax=Actinokineospora cianjurensis TaxID=585224 RepID=A0A421AXL0_9PSEU|nr:sigma-E factor regulatory protein RseB domain-containing protein [Actinokineospora cianjurensis]RLK54585.1 outer membrane lipoprotein-sorting protein [Actinokineospora cianjurensis]
MDRKRTALTVAAAGTAAGVVGLVLIASPAGANEAPPTLPPVSAEALVQSVIDAKIPALAGAVELRNNIGLPIPGLPQGSSDDELARVYADGQGRGRIALKQGGGERTFVQDGTTTWLWNSSDKSVTKFTSEAKDDSEEKLADPATAARDLVELLKKDSTVTVDGTARVADRAAYQLVLTPKPTERTLLREVRIAVDSETRVPLRLEVLANGQSDPALRIGFTQFSTGAQDPALFTFTPPAGAKVTEGKQEKSSEDKGELLKSADLKVVGEGWDVVATGKVPAALLSAQIPQSGERGGPVDATSILKKLGKEVSGSFGTGYVISTKVGTALVTADGRVAVGAVPQQVLIDALGQK